MCTITQVLTSVRTLTDTIISVHDYIEYAIIRRQKVENPLLNSPIVHDQIQEEIECFICTIITTSVPERERLCASPITTICIEVKVIGSREWRNVGSRRRRKDLNLVNSTQTINCCWFDCNC